MIKRILIPTDFTVTSLHGVRYALDLAEKFSAEIFIFHVVDEKMVQDCCRFNPDEETKTREKIARKSREDFEDFLKTVDFGKIPFQKALVFGTPFHEIVRKAREIKADLIVLGALGMAVDLNRVFFGNTAEKVVRMLPCPVLCVPPPEL